MYSFFTDKADIYRISRDENGKTEETLSGSVSGFLKAISLVQVQLGNGTFWEDYNFTCPDTADIIEWDKLKIGDRRFTVKWVGTKHSIQIKLKVCKVSLSNILQ